MAVEDINAEGGVDGRKLQLKVHDNTGRAEQAVSGIRKLLSVDDADVLFSAFTHITAAVVSEEPDAPLFYASTVSTFAANNTGVFRDYWDGRQHGERLAQRIVRDGREKVAFLLESSDVCENFRKGVGTILADENVTVKHTTRYNPRTKDFRVQLLKLAEQRPDAVVVCAWKHENSLMKTIQELNFSKSTYHLVAPYLPSANTEAINEIYSERNVTSTWYGFPEEDETERQNAFIRRYRQRYNATPMPDAAYAYDDIQILANAIADCPSMETSCLHEQIAGSTYDGVGGTVHFDQNGVSDRETYLIRMQNGSWSVVR